jgi:hypothetical protein
MLVGYDKMMDNIKYLRSKSKGLIHIKSKY